MTTNFPTNSESSTSTESEDAIRYRFLCSHPNWRFIESLCLQFGADDADQFKTGMDRTIDAHLKAGTTNWEMATAPSRSTEGTAKPTHALTVHPRTDLVPGVMHCAKCNFQLVRSILAVNLGQVVAGDSKTEPCPNGCGPLWPVTWEQYARQMQDAAETMAERAIAAEKMLKEQSASGTEHPDNTAVDAFAAAMKAKLSQARAKGRSGWDEPQACTIESLVMDLRKHVSKGDPVDVGNFAMMIHQRGGSTRLPNLPQDLVQAINNAPAGAHAIEHNGAVVFLNRGTSDVDMLAMADIPHGELQAKVICTLRLSGEIHLQMANPAVVPNDLESGMVVDVLYTPSANGLEPR